MAGRSRRVEPPVPVEVAYAVRIDPHWTEDAVCRNDDPDDWYPTTYKNARGMDTPHVVGLKRSCARCPVRLVCLVETLQAEGKQPLPQRHGVKGGMSPDERHGTYSSDWAKLEEERKKRIESCGPNAGTATGVKRHRSAREELCWPCREYKAAGRVLVADRQQEAATT